MEQVEPGKGEAAENVPEESLLAGNTSVPADPFTQTSPRQEQIWVAQFCIHPLKL